MSGLSHVSGRKQRVWEVCNGASRATGASGDAWWERGEAGPPRHCLSSPEPRDRAGSAQSPELPPSRRVTLGAVTGCDPSVSPEEGGLSRTGGDSTSLSYLGADFHNRNPEQCSQRAGGGRPRQGQRVGAGMG